MHTSLRAMGKLGLSDPGQPNSLHTEEELIVASTTHLTLGYKKVKTVQLRATSALSTLGSGSCYQGNME